MEPKDSAQKGPGPVQKNFWGNVVPEPVTYPTADGGSITGASLQKADKETQKGVMSIWFYAHYEDPVHACPHDSKEGGYQFVYGGPFDARQELNGEFDGLVSDEALDELAEELNDECPRWGGNSDISPDDVWDYAPSDALSKHLQFFKDSISNIRALLGVNVGNAEERHFRGMLYVSVITAMETYLLDNFTFCLKDDDAVFRKFIETTPFFKTQKFSLDTIFVQNEAIKTRGTAYLKTVIWHRLSESARLFRNTLGVHFPQDMTRLLAAVRIRHDFVHRNGRTADGEERNLTVEEIKELITEVENLVRGIEGQQQIAAAIERAPVWNSAAVAEPGPAEEI